MRDKSYLFSFESLSLLLVCDINGGTFISIFYLDLCNTIMLERFSIFIYRVNYKKDIYMKIHMHEESVN